MIPKVIHYCWMGGNKKSSVIKKCIKSWKKYCPDYEIKEWNESNFDINICPYVREAYDKQKWAFVSDYVRHYIMNEYGGVYLDTDVKLLKDPRKLFSTPLLAKETRDVINTGLIMVCEPKMQYCKDMLDEYNHEHFVLADGGCSTYTVCNRTTDYFIRLGLQGISEIEHLSGFDIYPPEYFCPTNYMTNEINITENTIANHLYMASWMSKSVARKKALQAFLGPNITKAIVKVKSVFRRK